MKFNLVQNTAMLLLGVVALAHPSSAEAGWGVLRGGSSGGGDSNGYASSGASSGGYTAAYGSSGYAAAYGSSGGASSGGYAAAYSSVGGSSGVYGDSSGSRPGLLHRVAERIHDHWRAKRARHAAHRAAYGSSGGYASSGGSVGYTTYASSGGGSSGGSGVSYGSSGGSVGYGSTGVSYGSTGVSYGSTGYSSGVSYGSSGVYYGASNSSASGASLVSSASTEGDAVYLTVAVPSDAKVFVNDDQTSSTGAVRKFVSHGLQAGKQYRFVVRAELIAADGRLLTEEKTLVVSAGEQEDVQFAFADSYSPIETAITLNLPEGAKVLLAGNETKATGETRTFRTSRLKVGELWDDYQIEVHYDGQVKRQAVRLVGGDQLQLTFDFNPDASNLAAR